MTLAQARWELNPNGIPEEVIFRARAILANPDATAADWLALDDLIAEHPGLPDSLKGEPKPSGIFAPEGLAAELEKVAAVFATPATSVQDEQPALEVHTSSSPMGWIAAIAAALALTASLYWFFGKPTPERTPVITDSRPTPPAPRTRPSPEQRRTPNQQAPVPQQSPDPIPPLPENQTPPPGKIEVDPPVKPAAPPLVVPQKTRELLAALTPSDTTRVMGTAPGTGSMKVEALNRVWIEAPKSVRFAQKPEATQFKLTTRDAKSERLLSEYKQDDPEFALRGVLLTGILLSLEYEQIDSAGISLGTESTRLYILSAEERSRYQKSLTLPYRERLQVLIDLGLIPEAEALMSENKDAKALAQLKALLRS